MIGFIIFGTTSITSKRGSGNFFCPQCGANQAYWEKGARRFVTLYFIPLIPLDLIDTWVECQECGGSFQNEVLQLDEGAIVAAFRDQFAVHARRLMTLMMLADGTSNDVEVQTIQQQYALLGGPSMTEEEWQEDLDLARLAHIDAIEYLEQVVDEFGVEQRERIAKSLFLVAAATVTIEPVQTELMKHLHAVLEISEERYRQLIEDALSE